MNGVIAALTGSQASVTKMAQTFRDRRDAFVGVLNQMGWQVNLLPATMYIWARLPAAWANQSVQFCQQLVVQTGVTASPGSGFSKFGEGYVRFALVQDPAILEVAAARIAEFIAG